MWNDNMLMNFSPSWINCIDESMSKWVNEYTCPGFMFVPRKPWPFGNEYEMIVRGIWGRKNMTTLGRLSDCCYG